MNDLELFLIREQLPIIDTWKKFSAKIDFLLIVGYCQILNNEAQLQELTIDEAYFLISDIPSLLSVHDVKLTILQEFNSYFKKKNLHIINYDYLFTNQIRIIKQWKFRYF